MLKVVATIAAVVLTASGASAQNRDLRVLKGADSAVTLTPDDFSASDMGYVRIGEWQTYYYAGFELGLRAFRTKADGKTLYVLSVFAPRLRAPGDIVSVTGRGGLDFKRLSTTAGRANCSSYSCRQDVAGSFEVPESVLASVRAGNPVDVRISTTCGTECDIIQPISYLSLKLLDDWVGTLPPPTTAPTP